jgi:hypothetical protein
MATWSDLKGEIRAELEEAVAAVYTDASLLVFYNQGALDFARRTHILQDEQKTSTAVGQQSYDLPDGTLDVFAAAYDDDKLARGVYSDFVALTASGTPTEFAVYDGALYLYPVPDTSASMTLLRYCEPVTATATTVIPFDLADSATLKSYVKACCNEQIGDIETANYFRGLYERDLTERIWSRTHAEDTGYSEPGVVW